MGAEVSNLGPLWRWRHTCPFADQLTEGGTFVQRSLGVRDDAAY
jgi:hypothetical protein